MAGFHLCHYSVSVDGVPTAEFDAFCVVVSQSVVAARLDRYGAGGALNAEPPPANPARLLVGGKGEPSSPRAT